MLESWFNAIDELVSSNEFLQSLGSNKILIDDTYGILLDISANTNEQKLLKIYVESELNKELLSLYEKELFDNYQFLNDMSSIEKRLKQLALQIENQAKNK